MKIIKCPKTNTCSPHPTPTQKKKRRNPRYSEKKLWEDRNMRKTKISLATVCHVCVSDWGTDTEQSIFTPSLFLCSLQNYDLCVLIQCSTFFLRKKPSNPPNFYLYIGRGNFVICMQFIYLFLSAKVRLYYILIIIAVQRVLLYIQTSTKICRTMVHPYIHSAL